MRARCVPLIACLTLASCTSAHRASSDLLPLHTTAHPVAVPPHVRSAIPQRQIALTFDADMTRGMLNRLRSGTVRSWYDAAIVAELRATRTPATIFLTGLWAEQYPAVVASLARDPLFELENHSMDHSAFHVPCSGLPAAGSRNAKRAEVLDAAAVIERLSGTRPHYFRFPGGCHDDADTALVSALGERVIGWDVVSHDAFQNDVGEVVRAVEDHASAGSIVVMHLVGAPNAPATARALRAIIPNLRTRGFTFVTLEALLGRT